MKKFTQSNTANKCWNFNSVLDFSDPKIHISEAPGPEKSPTGLGETDWIMCV